MQYAIISDVHANIEALTAVLARIDELEIDRVFCLGDLVGYHADPNACVELARLRKIRCITGNHDRAAVGMKNPRHFGSAGRHAIRWTRRVLSEENRRFLGELPVWDIVDGCFVAVHGALHPAPNEDLHLSTDERVVASFARLSQSDFGASVCFYGHTHWPISHEWRHGRLTVSYGHTVAIRPGSLYLINPGSVGQPRDGDGRASFAIFDAVERTVVFHRVPFDAMSCRTKAHAAGLFDAEPVLLASSAWISSGIATAATLASRVVRRALSTRVGRRFVGASSPA